VADYTTPTGQVRLHTADLDEANPVVSDEIIEGYLTMHGGDVLLAAADVLDAVATTELLLAKKIRTQDLSTDGPAVAAELRKKAAELRTRAYDASGAGAWFDVVGFAPYGHLEGVEYRA
jgi:hypothetical protein